MYTLLIIDDEKEIRGGLMKWDWARYNIEAKGACSHGLEALQFMERHPVDIVLTDIRMPFMNGLELMEAMKRRYPFTKMVILSGYSDFNYAKEAILHGAVDYLLKPVNEEELAESFSKLAARLDEEKQTEYRNLVLMRKEKLLTDKLREEFLSRLLREGIPEDELEQASSEGEVLLEGDAFTVAAGRLDRLALLRAPVSDREMKLFVFSLDNLLSDLWDAQGNCYHLVDKANADFYLLAAKPTQQENYVQVIRQMERLIGLFKSTVSMGIGVTVLHPSEIRRSAQTARHCLHRNAEEASVTLYNSERDPLPKAESSDEVIPAANGIQLVSRETESAVLAYAKQFIRDHYQRSLTLKEVAAAVYVSPGHLSALFKDSGETFLKYLTSVRIQAAMELMKDLSKKVYEVVEMVGYADPAYFSEVFKKYTGKTPQEFRSQPL